MAPLRASLARSPPRLGRSQAGGTPRPPGLRPLARLRAPGPCCLGHPAGGFRAQVRPVAGVVNRLRLSTLDAQPLAVFGLREKFKRWAVRMHGRGVGGVPPLRRRWATRPRRWAARVQPQAVPAVHGLGEVVHGRPGSGRSGRGCLAVSPEDKNQERMAGELRLAQSSVPTLISRVIKIDRSCFFL